MRRSIARLLLLFPLALLTRPALALDPAWLDAVPSADRIQADVQGAGALDTAARQ